MAKVTDLNRCFVKCNPSSPKGLKASKAAYNSSENGLVGYIVQICDGGLLIARDEKEMRRAYDHLTAGLINEIYFNDGEFFDEPMVFQDSDLLDIPWTDGSIDEQEVIDWENGDHCIWSGTKATFIGYSKSHGSRCAIEFLRGNCSVIETVFIEDISKPETEAEKKTRELAEEVNRICFELFGTPAFDCNQDIIDTVEKFVVNGYKKVD